MPAIRPESYVKITNVVSVAYLGDTFPLIHLCVQWNKMGYGAEYNPKKFPAVKRRFNDPPCCALVFESGKVVISGCKHDTECRYYLARIAREIRQVGIYTANMYNMKPCNRVSSMNPLFTIDIERMAAAHTDVCTYEPELFPGVVVKTKWGKVLVFKSGRFVVAGPRSLVQSYMARQFALELSQNFRTDKVGKDRALSQERSMSSVSSPDVEAPVGSAVAPNIGADDDDCMLVDEY